VSDIDRIKQMVQDGRITQEEADRLIEVLSEAQAADEELQQAGAEIDAEAQAALAAPEQAANQPDATASGADPASEARQPAEPPALPSAAGAQAPLPPLAAPTGQAPHTPAEPVAPRTPPTPPTPPVPPPPPPPPAPHPPAAEAGAARPRIAPDDARWVRIEMLAGDLEVSVDPDITRPSVESDGAGNLIFEESPEGFRIRWDQAGGSNFLDRLVGRLRTGNIDVQVPAGFGVDLAATAGNVELEGVPYLRGHLTAGNLDAHGLKGIDLVCRAGDIDLGLELTEGAHRINVTTGDVNVRLARGSSVTVKADVSIGDADSSVEGIRATGRGLGAGLEGATGGGAATLDIHLTTGDLELEVDHG